MSNGAQNVEHGRSNLSNQFNQNSTMNENARSHLDHSFNRDYLPNELTQANAGHRGNLNLAQKSYESQQLAAASTYNSAGSAQDTCKSTENLGTVAPRPMVAPYVGGERFLQPFIPGQSADATNMR